MRNDGQQGTARRLLYTGRRISNTNRSVHRARGYLTDFSIKRPYRNARVCRIYEGAKDIEPLVIFGQGQQLVFDWYLQIKNRLV
jgi:hypothetical protein